MNDLKTKTEKTTDGAPKKNPWRRLPKGGKIAVIVVGILAVLAVLGGIGALVYFKFIKQKPKTKGSDNLDDYDYGEDDTEQEDEDPWETEESDEPEDADRGGDEESENPAK